jgi:AraC family chitin signaling transcriptional activator
MSSRLDQIKDLAPLAKNARYNATTLAKLCGVSPRQLHRHIETKHHTTPHKYLHELRMSRSLELVRDRTPIKEASIELGYKDPAHFTHDFTHYFGMSPSKFAEQQPELLPSVKNVRF